MLQVSIIIFMFTEAKLSLPVLRIRIYFFRIRGSVLLNYGSGSGSQLFTIWIQI